MAVRLLIVSLLLVNFGATAQESSPRRKSAYFIEAGGPSILPSLNFDTRFSKGGMWGISTGIGYYPGENQFTFATNLNYLFGKRAHFTEFGLGAGYGSSRVSLLDEEVPDDFLYGQLNIGYRMHPARGMLLRLGANLLVGSGGGIILPYLGLGLAR